MPVRDYLTPFTRRPSHYLPGDLVTAIKESRKRYLETGERVLIDRSETQIEHCYMSYQIYMENINDNLKMFFVSPQENQMVADFTRGMIYDGALLHLGCWLAQKPVGDTYDFNHELQIILSKVLGKEKDSPIILI